MGTRRFAYNSRHQQTRVETENGRVQENRYDAENLRFELLENGRRTSFVYHKGELLHEEGREEQKSSYHLGMGIDAFQRGQELSYCHRDEQLSMALITGGEGEVQNSYRYDAFGVQLEEKEQFHNRIRYTGQQYDKLTKQYYLRARYYNPVLGRFMQEDVYQGDGLNLYAYCGNNPVVYYDPSGYAEDCHAEQHGGDGSTEEKFDSQWERYLDDIEQQTGRKIPENQRRELLNELNNTPHDVKLQGLDYQHHREDFNDVKSDLIDEWEKQTGQSWPTYLEDVVSSRTNNAYIPAGSNYDAHEIIPNVYNSPLKWWNLHPAANPTQHQGGIHRSGAPIRDIFK